MLSGSSKHFLLNFSSVLSIINFKIEIKNVFGVFKDKTQKKLNFKIKHDESSTWIFSTKDRNIEYNAFNCVSLYVPERGNELERFRVNTRVTKYEDNIDDQVNVSTVEMLIEYISSAVSDELVSNICFNCFNLDFTMECRILKIEPLRDNIQYKEKTSLTLKKKTTPYLVGHRGLGQEDLAVYENTVYGFNRCASLNMDFVELDVHFTKDEEIIVFHDFFMDKEYCGKKDEIRLLTYKEIQQQLKSRPSTCLFPTLNEVMCNVSDNIGILMEMKYPLLRCDGKRENNNPSKDPNIYYMPKNEYVDKILNVVFKNLILKPRKIVFISFDPDICLLVKLKQNSFPVFSITRGILLDDVINHADSRIFNYNNVALWSSFCGFDGIVCRYHECLKDNYKNLKDTGLLTFLYGKIPRSKDFYEESSNMGVDGLIIDDCENYLNIIQTA